ncbi:hypothetical protein [Amycolatopsis echigonensis]|uniref:Uncharacterized protein n=1 Tax=Amycolatopsis echigonensis TaxID=2576905 RepID=A0A8E2B7P8_9PSEU|nr:MULTISPECIES: hypothetical protein [Amycolatopsis]MBB2503640.1 hypothetical protein [Amycolatopsis echigonensis]
MEREVLMALLRSGSGEAWSLAADALAHGAVWEGYGSNVTASLSSIFRRRRKVAERAGQYSVGFDAAVHALNAWGGHRLKLGQIEDKSRSGMVFQLFLNTESDAVVACFGIEPPAYRGKFSRPGKGT